MKPSTLAIANDEDLLAILAMRFRRTTDCGERRHIAREYSDAVDRLIQRGTWEEAPPPEDQLPNPEMPSAFFEFWCR
jgi:hypothetical protein